MRIAEAIAVDRPLVTWAVDVGCHPLEGGTI